MHVGDRIVREQTDQAIRKHFGTFEVVFIVLTFIAMGAFAGVFLFIRPSFLSMYRDFGGDLPWITSTVTHPIFGASAILLSNLLLCAGVVMALRRGRSGRAILIVTLLSNVVALGVTLVGLYAPIFVIAESITP